MLTANIQTRPLWLLVIKKGTNQQYTYKRVTFTTTTSRSCHQGPNQIIVQVQPTTLPATGFAMHSRWGNICFQQCENLVCIIIIKHTNVMRRNLYLLDGKKKEVCRRQRQWTFQTPLRPMITYDDVWKLRLITMFTNVRFISSQKWKQR